MAPRVAPSAISTPAVGTKPTETAHRVVELLGPAQIRALADQLGIRPTKTLGQNFVHDAGTVRKIVREAQVCPGDRVVEIGPGLGSLTLALLEADALVSAVEIDPSLAAQLPATITRMAPQKADNFALLTADALQITGPADLPLPPAALIADADAGAGAGAGAEAGIAGGGAGFAPEKLVANLPYNVAVPALITAFEKLDSLRSALIMVQAEVADRLAAGPGSRTYGIPSVKLDWYGTAQRVATISRTVFWPVPNVDSALVKITAHPHARPERWRKPTFAVIDAAFAQRRKTLRGALAQWAGSAQRAEQILRNAGISPQERGENLRVEDFYQIAVASE